MKEEEKWFDFSADDIDSAEIMLKAGKYNIVCFFAHQASEKALKAFLVSKKLNPPRTHNLVDLTNLCARYDRSFKNILTAARMLNQFYIPTRYPFATPGMKMEDPGIEMAEKALDYAREIFSCCRNLAA
ncbi:MAG: HEPN domain-containing protein [Clostridiaceae bacterium]|nr:HEPN domain-containing protein [Clostridiaceae bacterium]